MAKNLVVPARHIGIAVANWGGLQAYALGPTPEEGVLVEEPFGIFNDRTVFVLHTPYDAGDGYDVPLAVFYRIQQAGTVRTIGTLQQVTWEARKTDFMSSFPARVQALRRDKRFRYFTDLEQSGELVRVANEAANGCNWSVVVCGVGRMACVETDPFDKVNAAIIG